VLTVDQTAVMERAQAATDLMLERTGLSHLLEAPARLWQATHYDPPGRRERAGER
jgi:hypothetical protein